MTWAWHRVAEAQASIAACGTSRSQWYSCPARHTGGAGRLPRDRLLQEAVALLCSAGFVGPVVTVQSKIGKGLFTWLHVLDQALTGFLSVYNRLVEGIRTCW